MSCSPHASSIPVEALVSPNPLFTPLQHTERSPLQLHPELRRAGAPRAPLRLQRAAHRAAGAQSTHARPLQRRVELHRAAPRVRRARRARRGGRGAHHGTVGDEVGRLEDATGSGGLN